MRAAAGASALCVSALALGLTAPGSSAVAWPGRPFSPHSVWNARLGADAPVARDSRRLVRNLVGQVQAAHGSWLNTWQYSVPVYVVGDHQHRVKVSLDTEDPSLQRAFDSVPIPRDARPALGSDAQLTVWQPGRDLMWDFWKLHREADGWHARWGGEMTNVSRNPGYFENQAGPLNWGATATGLPLLGGLITFNDLRRGYIDHAVSLAIPHTEARYWVWPAQRTDGDISADAGTAIPEGTQFRLDPHIDLRTLGLSGLALMIARAAQRYGVIVRDKAGAVTFYGQAPTGGRHPWNEAFGDRYPNQALAGFPWGDLQALKAPAHCCWAPH